VGKTRLLLLISACYANADSPFRRILALKECTIREMQHDLAAWLKLDWNTLSSSQEHCRARIISEHLKHDSFLLLLDDVQDGDLDLASVGLPMPLGYHQKVILTSKSQAACGRMGCTEANTVEMKCLGEEDAWNLFKYKVGVEVTDANAEIHKIAKLVSYIWNLFSYTYLPTKIVIVLTYIGFSKQMVSACGGLPRAICSVGIAMAGATGCGTNPDYWWYAYERFKANKLPGCSGLGTFQGET
jgi:hypothetical protein